MSWARGWRPPRFIRLPPPELTPQARELDRQFCELSGAPPAARLWGGRVVGNVGMDLVADPPIALKLMSAAAHAEAARLYQTILGTPLPDPRPDLQVWTLEWCGALLGTAPVWWPQTSEIPLLLEVAVAPSEFLDGRTSGYLRQALIGQQLQRPGSDLSQDFSQPPGLAVARTLTDGPETRALMQVGFQPLP